MILPSRYRQKVHNITADIWANECWKKRIAIIECKDSANMHEEIVSSLPVLKAAWGYNLMKVGER